MKNKLILLLFTAVILCTAVSALSAQSLRTIQEKGPMFITSISFLQGLSRLPYNIQPGEEGLVKNNKNANIPLVSLSQCFGFKFTPYFGLGLGINFEYWTVKNAFVPVYADIRFNMTKGKIAPHAYLNLGYASRWHINDKPYKASTGNSNEYIIHGATSGVMGEIGIGVKASIGRSSAMIITASVKAQETALRYYSDNTQGSQNSDNTVSQSMKPLLVNTNANSVYLFIGVKAGFVF
jgi:hypothetical protein